MNMPPEDYKAAGEVFKKSIIEITHNTSVAHSGIIHPLEQECEFCEKVKENKRTECVQCNREMIRSYGNEAWCAPFCEYPECPNYGLLQAGVLREEIHKDK